MYIHCKQGFVEADRWDGQKLSIRAHQQALLKIKAKGDTPIVLRSRESETLEGLLALAGIKRKVYDSPPTWDYQFRAYVGAREWGTIMTAVSLDLDYRNFKSWSGRNRTRSGLAHDIWHVAHKARRESWYRDPMCGLDPQPARGG